MATKAAETPKIEPEKYPVSEFITHSKKLFGVMPEVVVGALHGKETELFTKAEVGNAIKSFRKRKVK